jgi:hypothetical protein
VTKKIKTVSVAKPVEAALRALEREGLAESFVDADGEIRWRLTRKGLTVGAEREAQRQLGLSDDVRLTERGRRTLRAPDGLRADKLLYMEILARIGGCASDKNVDGMTDQLIARFSSAEVALTAVK